MVPGSARNSDVTVVYARGRRGETGAERMTMLVLPGRLVSRPAIEAVEWWERGVVAGRSRRSEWHEVVQRSRRPVEKLCG